MFKELFVFFLLNTAQISFATHFSRESLRVILTPSSWESFKTILTPKLQDNVIKKIEEALENISLGAVPLAKKHIRENFSAMLRVHQNTNPEEIPAHLLAFVHGLDESIPEFEALNFMSIVTDTLGWTYLQFPVQKIFEECNLEETSPSLQKCRSEGDVREVPSLDLDPMFFCEHEKLHVRLWFKFFTAIATRLDLYTEHVLNPNCDSMLEEIFREIHAETHSKLSETDRNFFYGAFIAWTSSPLGEAGSRNFNLVASKVKKELEQAIRSYEKLTAEGILWASDDDSSSVLNESVIEEMQSTANRKKHLNEQYTAIDFFSGESALESSDFSEKLKKVENTLIKTYPNQDTEIRTKLEAAYFTLLGSCVNKLVSWNDITLSENTKEELENVLVLSAVLKEHLDCSIPEQRTNDIQNAMTENGKTLKLMWEKFFSGELSNINSITATSARVLCFLESSEEARNRINSYISKHESGM